jgi:hypothetical protein
LDSIFKFSGKKYSLALHLVEVDTDPAPDLPKLYADPTVSGLTSMVFTSRLSAVEADKGKILPNARPKKGGQLLNATGIRYIFYALRLYTMETAGLEAAEYGYFRGLFQCCGSMAFWIWIRGSMSLTNGSGSGSCYFPHFQRQKDKKQ